jgi:16S rRNA (guanine527-N7)-methyltransferase
MKNLEKLQKLAHLVEAKSKVVNITAIRDFDAIWQKHILDSLYIVDSNTWVELTKDQKNLDVLDFGTGGGFPGLPMAIEHPHIKFMLIDGTRKKIDAVAEFSRALDLQNIQVAWGRGEELIKEPKFRGKFDAVVSRAVAYLPTLIEMTKDFLKPNGTLIFYKTFNEQEINDGTQIASQYGLKIQEIFKYKLENDELERCIIFIG